MSQQSLNHPITRTFYIFKHKTRECADDVTSLRTFPETSKNKDETIDCINPDCDGELIYDTTYTVDNTFPLTDAAQQAFIDNLSPYERTVLLGMVMESIGRSWRAIENRLAIIGYICTSDNTTELSEDFIAGTIENALTLYTNKQLPSRTHDGRVFKGYAEGDFGELWNRVEPDQTTMKKLTTHIPNDEYWTDTQIQNRTST